MIPPPPKRDSRPVCVEMFAGAGGLALGMERAGFRHALLVEWDARACETLRTNRPAWPVRETDANTVDWTPWVGLVAALVGGPPCQPWSTGGKQRGEADPRNGWPAFLRAARALRPVVVAAENVPGMESGKLLAYRDCIIAEFQELFAWVGLWRLDAADYGAPQFRERFVLVAGPRPILLPKPTHHRDPGPIRRMMGVRSHVTLREAWGLPPTATAIQRGHGYLPDRSCNLDVPGPTVRTVPFDAGIDVLINESGRLTARELAVAAARSAPSGHLAAIAPPRPRWDRAVVVDGLRVPTTAESARLQDFPADWEFAGSRGAQTKQIGNAVNVRVAEAIGRVLRGAL